MPEPAAKPNGLDEGKNENGGKARNVANPAGVTWLKEFVAAALAIAIAVMSIWMLVDTYGTASEVVTVTAADLENSQLYQAAERLRLERRSGQRDIMLVAIGLFGSVIGYYFGRVPAERRADQAAAAAGQAQQNANAARKETAAAQTEKQKAEGLRDAAERKVQDARTTTVNVLTKLQGTSGAQRKTLSGGGGAPTAGPEVLEANVQLEELLRRLG